MNKTDKLPFGLKASDLKYPTNYSQITGMTHYIHLYNTVANGWLVATLGISGAGKSKLNNTPRTYAVNENGDVFTVGKGPHVKQVITAIVTSSRSKRLKKLLEVYEKGLEKANTIRDRISTRRARTSMRRALWY